MKGLLPVRMRVGFKLLFLFAFLAVADLASASGTSTRVHVTLVQSGGTGPLRGVEARLVAKPVPREGAETPKELTVAFEHGEADINLPEGSWILAAQSPGLWAAPVLVEDRQGVPQRMTVNVWPAGTLSGTVVTPSTEPAPTKIVIRFEATPRGRVIPSIPGATIVCPISNVAWKCDLPVGTLDVKLKVDAFLAQYLWDVAITAGKTRTVAPLQLQRGASLVGWVKRPDGRAAAQTTVELMTPAHGAIQGKNGALTSTTNDRGFFQIGPVPPANYLIVARREGFANAESPAQILRDIETTLNTPLVLTPSETIEFQVNPPTHPSGLQWTIGLRRFIGSSRMIPAYKAVVPPDGRWTRPRVSAGKYMVTLSTTDTTWFSQEVQIPSPVPLAINLTFGGIHGSVKMGRDPLRATVTVGGLSGVVRIPFQTDDRGEFAGALPANAFPGEKWPIAVESDDPSVQRTLDVPVVNGPTGLEVEIVIPATELKGEVVGVDGSAWQQPAVVTANVVGDRPEAIQVRLHGTTSGTFHIAGLPIGRASVEAESGGRTSRPVEVNLVEEVEPPMIRLVLQDNFPLTVQVVSPEGDPIPEASLLAFPAQMKWKSSELYRSDGSGRVQLGLPQDTRSVALEVTASGYAYVMKLVEIPVTHSISVVLPRNGGTLHVSLNEGKWPSSPRPRLWLRHGGATESPEGLRYLLASSDPAAMAGETSPQGTIVLPHMAPGEYSLCPGDLFGLSTPSQQQKCAIGTLSPGGQLSLKAPPAGPQNSP